MPSPITDFSIFDGGELVTYQPQNDPPLADVPALRRPLTQSGGRNIERYIQLDPTDVVFHLDATPFGTIGLVAGDLITDANSQVYQVLFVERQTLNNTLFTVCRPS